jgi:hypothetical protein
VPAAGAPDHHECAHCSASIFYQSIEKYRYGALLDRLSVDSSLTESAPRKIPLVASIREHHANAMCMNEDLFTNVCTLRHVLIWPVHSFGAPSYTSVGSSKMVGVEAELSNFGTDVVLLIASAESHTNRAWIWRFASTFQLKRQSIMYMAFF